MNTYGIVRVSTIGQEENTSIQFQTEKLAQYATLNNLHLKKVITDVCSGSYETRDGIDELKSFIDDGKVDVVLIWNTSRAFRSMIAFSKFYEYLKKNDVELISVSEGIRSSRKEGEMMFGIMCSVAGYEKDIIVERMMSGKILKAKNGENRDGSGIRDRLWTGWYESGQKRYKGTFEGGRHYGKWTFWFENGQKE